jgi:hypothetical protein
MGRKSKTELLTESSLGQHLALSVAAHLARTQLVPDPLGVYDARHKSEMVDAVGNALAKVAPLYVQDTNNFTARELSPSDLDGAAVRRGATILVLKDGRTLSSVSMKRADLRQAIAILRAVGIPELHPPPPTAPPAPKAEPPRVLAQLDALESLLCRPLIDRDVEKASTIAVGIARHARHGRVANLAMQLVSTVQEARHDGEAENRRVSTALARLRAALEETEGSDGFRPGK